MTSHQQTQPLLNSFTGDFFAKRSNSNFETSKPPIKTWRTVGGIDESPLHPKHTPTSATHLLNSRLFNKTHLHHPSPPQFTVPRGAVTPRNASNSSPFTRTHKNTLSDSTLVPTNQRSAIPTHHYPAVTTHQPPPSHSVVASLGLAPISNSIPSRHPFNLRPLHISKDPSNNLHSSYISPCQTANSLDPSLSLPQLPSIPSLLNPARANSLAIDQPPTHKDDAPSSDYTKFTLHSFYDTHHSPPLSLEIKASDQPCVPNSPLLTRSLTDPVHARPTHPSPPSVGSPKDSESHLNVGMNDLHVPGRIEPSVLPLETNSLERRTDRPDGTCLLFEPAGKAFVKYAVPKPSLNANKLAQRSNLIEPPLLKAQNRDGKIIPPLGNYPGMPVSKNLHEISSDPSLEELRDRYWNSKNYYYDANQVWAEIYISKLERKIWKSEAEADISVDCFKFCTPLGSNNKSKKLHRRTSSAPNLKHMPKSTSLFNIDHRGSSKTNFKTHHDGSAPWFLRSKPDKPLRKAFPVSKALSNGFPCMNPNISRTDSNAHKPGFTTRHRANSAPRPFISPREGKINGPKIPPESGYRIIIPNAPNSAIRNPKTLWRRSRSVPNLHEGFDSPHHATEIPDPNSSTNLNIPQSLLDAMFLPPPGSKGNSAPFSSEKLPSFQSPARNLNRTSKYATIETHDDTCSSFNPDFPSEITQATESGPKGPLHSLPRFIEPRSNGIVALPPPPRKRTLTPVASTDSTSGASLPGTKRSTSQSTPPHSSWGAPSQKTHPKSSSPSSSRLNRRFSPALTIRSHHPQATSDHASTSPIALPRLSTSMLHSRHPSRSLPTTHQISPSIESAIDSVKRLSQFVSEASSPPGSLDLKSSVIDDEYGSGSLNIPPYNQPPLSAFPYAKLTPRLDSTRIVPEEDHVPIKDVKIDLITTDTQPCPNPVAFTACSSVSSPSRSSHSVIDPDKYIDQADLFYQMPTSPQRDLIEDYDNHIFKTMQTLDNLPVSSVSSSTHSAQSRLIDQILAGYNVAPRRQKSTVLNQRHEGTASEVISTMTENQLDALTSSKPESHSFPIVSQQTQSRSSVDKRIPKIVDAFEARLSGILEDDQSHKNRS